MAYYFPGDNELCTSFYKFQMYLESSDLFLYLLWLNNLLWLLYLSLNLVLVILINESRIFRTHSGFLHNAFRKSIYTMYIYGMYMDICIYTHMHIHIYGIYI